MSANRVWLWGLVVAAIGGVLWYRSAVLVDPSAIPTRTTRVVFVTGGSDDYWKLAAKGAEEAARDHDAELRVEMPSQDEGLVQQMQILVELRGDEVDGCAVSPLDAEGQTRLINHLAEKMSVVTFDSDAPLSQRQFYVGTSNYRAGKICHELVREALPSGGKIGVLLSNFTKSNMLERKAGYEESQKASVGNQTEGTTPSVWQTVEYMIDEGDVQRTKENIRKVLEKHEDLDCLVGMNGYHGPILLDALLEADKLGKIKLIAFDEAEATLDGIVAGSIYATIAQDPYKYGYEAVRMLTSLHNGQSSELPIVGGGAINVQCQPIRQADVEDFRKRLKQRLGDAKSTQE